MLIVETRIFTKRVQRIMNADDYRKLQNALVEMPDMGKIIKGSGGIRKIRWIGSSRGKRSGSRVIYYWLNSKKTIVMLLIYKKNEIEELSSNQLSILRKIVEKEFNNAR